MTLDHAVALSLLENLPRIDLTERLKNDLDLVERASLLVEQARVVRERAERAGIQVVAWNQPEFPAALATLTDLPPVLWYRGHLSATGSPSLAIVGSRAASAVAVETALRLSADVAAAGITVVSGLARGVDSAAHRGALRTGRTIAVLGSGVDRVYPAEHVPLAQEIARTGLIVSEFPPGTPPLPHHFPMRNRLISGLALAVVVIEASEKSGSLITASCALEQGRDVMVVPANILNGRNKGGHALLRDGATIVESADDILRELDCPALPGPAAVRLVSGGPHEASGDPLIHRMAPGQSYDVDELAALSGLGLSRLLPRLLDLELRGLLRRAGNGCFLRPFRTC
jgi:DNA processing protein